jgi:hypothetical protein
VNDAASQSLGPFVQHDAQIPALEFRRNTPGVFNLRAGDRRHDALLRGKPQGKLTAMVLEQNPTWTNMAALAARLHGAVLMGHSESGFFPEQAALIDPIGVKGIISIEMPCQALTARQISTLAKIPILVMFGDHLGDVQGGPASWTASFDSCQKFVE